MTAPATGVLLAALTARGATARFVGGAVRDALLGRPSQDLDLAIDRPPPEVLRLLQAAGIRTLATGLAHGTVTALVGGSAETPAVRFEITTLRRDVETFGRRARVAFTDDWSADAARRDFTLNALYADADGTLYDPEGGLPDLEAGRVRFVGPPARRIEEDALRLLRFFRFHAYFGRGEADGAALEACAGAAARLEDLSGERLWGEFSRLLLAPQPAEVVALMAACGVLSHLLPASPGAAGPEKPGDGAILARLCRLEDLLGSADAIRRLAALLPAAPAGAVAAARFRLSRGATARLVALLDPEPGLSAAISRPALRRLLYRAGREAIRDRLLLHWARAGEEAADAGWRARLAEAEGWNQPSFPLQGEDVLALGIAAGPEVGRLLARLETWWEQADFRPGRAAALAELRRLCGR